MSPGDNRMYSDLAYLWPLISCHADYVDEARIWTSVLREKLGPGRHLLLELGVGGGNNLHHILYPRCRAEPFPVGDCICNVDEELDAKFNAVAVDVSDAMLQHSRALNPTVEHRIGDMRSIDLGRKFNAVLIHDAISYMLSQDDIRATLHTARSHLNSGGVLVMAPDWFTETFRSPQLAHDIRRDTARHFTYIEYSHDPDPTDTTVESLIFCILERDDGTIDVQKDRHVTGLFSIETWLKLMNETGFDAEKYPYPVHEDGREGVLLVGTLKR